MKKSAVQRAMLHFGLRVVEERQALGLTQDLLAERVGRSRRQMNRVEAGTANVSLELIIKIADALGVPIADLFSGPSSSTVRRPGRRIGT